MYSLKHSGCLAKLSRTMSLRLQVFQGGAEAQPVASDRVGEADGQELKEMVGGEDQFNELKPMGPRTA